MAATTYIGPKIHKNMPLIYLSILTMVAAAWYGHCRATPGQCSGPSNTAVSLNTILKSPSISAASSAVMPIVQYMQSGPAFIVTGT
jgi:hypothetical protein